MHISVYSCVEVYIFIMCILCMCVWYVCVYAHAELRDKSFYSDKKAFTPKSVLLCPDPLFINTVFLPSK